MVVNSIIKTKIIKTVYKKVSILIVICAFVLLSACDSKNKLDYYSQKDNYVNVVGTVTYIHYNEHYDALYFNFSDLNQKFDDSCFKIVGDNLSIALDNGIDQKIGVGSQVEFITAPKYFGDGYVMPIVSISVEGEVLLKFEEGFSNLLKWLEEK